MTEFQLGDEFNDNEMREAEDTADLFMPELMAEAATTNGWDETLAFNFIRRAYLKGRADGIQQMADEIKDVF